MGVTGRPASVNRTEKRRSELLKTKRRGDKKTRSAQKRNGGRGENGRGKTVRTKMRG